MRQASTTVTMGSKRQRKARIDHVNCICALLLMTPLPGWAETVPDDDAFGAGLKADIAADFRYHYSAQPLTDVAVGFGITALLANSNADAEIQQFFREQLQNDTGDSLANVFTDVGNLAQPLFSIPIYLGVIWLGDRNAATESAAPQWAANSLRASLVAMPELVALAYIAGGQRPEEGAPGWNPFDDNNGVSGHAFFGAVPIITAAKMTDKRWLRYTLYATSTLPGFARVYEDKHYFSQAFMGWWLANAAARTVEHSNFGRQSSVRLLPLLYPDGGGLQFSMRF